MILCDGSNGCLYGNGKQIALKADGEEFREGDIVEVEVDFKVGRVMWVVNGELSTSYFMENIKDEGVKWVPLLQFSKAGDQVECITP